MIGVLRPQRSTILSRRGSGRPSVNGSIGTMNPSGGTGRSGSTSNVLIRTSISLGREALAVARPPDRLLAPGIEGSRRMSATYSLLRAVPRRSRGIADRRFEFELRFAGEEAYCSTFAFDVGRVRRAQLRGRPTPESGDVLGRSRARRHLTRCRSSNTRHRAPDSSPESGALPLGHSPVTGRMIPESRLVQPRSPSTPPGLTPRPRPAARRPRERPPGAAQR